MTRVCKKLSLPKKAAVEAIAMFEMSYGGGPATAHDVFLAMQEIPFILKRISFPKANSLLSRKIWRVRSHSNGVILIWQRR